MSKVNEWLKKESARLIREARRLEKEDPEFYARIINLNLMYAQQMREDIRH